MENLELQTKSQESKDRAWQHDASLQKGEKPRKQVQFEVDEELGDEPDLPSDLAHFLAEGTAHEQRNTPSSNARTPTPTNSSQHRLALTGGAQP